MSKMPTLRQNPPRQAYPFSAKISLNKPREFWSRAVHVYDLQIWSAPPGMAPPNQQPTTPKKEKKWVQETNRSVH